MSVADTLVDTPVDGATSTHTDPQSAFAAGFVPDASRAERVTGFDVDLFPVPKGREEDWRFTPVKKIAALLSGDGSGTVERTLDLPDHVTGSVISLEQAREMGILPPQDRAAAVAAASADEVLLIDIAAEAEVDAPVRLRLAGTGLDAAYVHLVIHAGRFSKATVVIEHVGTASCSELVSVVTDDGSDLTVVSAQRWADDALYLAQHDALVGRDARFRHVSVTLGGAVVRVNANVRYAGPGGDASLLGVYFADAGQHLEHRSFVDHNTPHCKSRVTYKGALQGESARTVWVGDVLIRKEAEGTDTYELNRNLVLTDGARADSVPNLEIETGEIKGAGHASATGRFDDLQLFYLQSRGITEDEAKRLVVRGFFVDIIREIPVSDLRDEITAAIEDELASTEYAAATAHVTSATSVTSDTTDVTDITKEN